MDVYIDEVVSTVHAVDEEAVLTPALMQRIVETVLRAIEERERHAARVSAEQRIGRGVVDVRDAGD